MVRVYVARWIAPYYLKDMVNDPSELVRETALEQYRCLNQYLYAEKLAYYEKALHKASKKGLSYNKTVELLQERFNLDKF